MKSKFPLLIFLISFGASAQTLTFRYVQHPESAKNNIKLENKIDSLLFFLKAEADDFQYSSIVSDEMTYGIEPHMVKSATIGTAKPAVFARLQNNLDKKLIPIFITKKRNQALPYFSAYIIKSKVSEIDSLTSSLIERVYYPHENSTSGFVAPLHKLWEMNLISNPSKLSIMEDLGWDPLPTGRNESVEAMVAKSTTSVGFTGELPSDSSDCEVLLRFSLLPQDVVFISQDLRSYESLIKRYFREEMLETGALAKSSAKITDLVNFGNEHSNAYQNLSEMVKRIDRSAEGKAWNYQLVGFKKGITISDWFDIFEKTDGVLKYIVSILTSVASILGFRSLFTKNNA